MKKSEFKNYIKERIISELSEAEIEIPADDLKVAEPGDTIKVTEEDDVEPTDKDLKKKDSVAKTATKLKDTTTQMRALAKKFKDAEGEEKEKIKDQLKTLTKVKKELEAML